MNAKTDIPSARSQEKLTAGILRRFAQVAFVFVVQAIILFVGAGRLDWTWAWVFLGICLASVSINATFMLRTNPETIVERGRPKEMKKWDKIVSGLWSFALFLVVPLVAGLDVWFNWTQDLSAAGNIAGALLLAVGLGLSGWAMTANVYFSTAARI